MGADASHHALWPVGPCARVSGLQVRRGGGGTHPKAGHLLQRQTTRRARTRCSALPSDSARRSSVTTPWLGPPSNPRARQRHDGVRSAAGTVDERPMKARPPAKSASCFRRINGPMKTRLERLIFTCSRALAFRRHPRCHAASPARDRSPATPDRAKDTAAELRAEDALVRQLAPVSGAGGAFAHPATPRGGRSAGMLAARARARDTPR